MCKNINQVLHKTGWWSKYSIRCLFSIADVKNKKDLVLYKLKKRMC